MVESTKDSLKSKIDTPTPTSFDINSATISEITARFASLVETYTAL